MVLLWKRSAFHPQTLLFRFLLFLPGKPLSSQTFGHVDQDYPNKLATIYTLASIKYVANWFFYISSDNLSSQLMAEQLHAACLTKTDFSVTFVNSNIWKLLPYSCKFVQTKLYLDTIDQSQCSDPHFWPLPSTPPKIKQKIKTKRVYLALVSLLSSSNSITDWWRIFKK